MSLFKKSVITFILCFATGLVSMAQAEDYAVLKGKPLTIIVAYAAGGAADVNARIVAKYLEPVIGVPVLVENVAGAGGLLGAKKVATSNDNHMILQANSGMMLILPYLTKDLDVDLRSKLKFVANTRTQPTYLMVPPDSPYHSWRDIEEAARKNPGTINYASAGQGSSYHISMAQIEASAKLKLIHVPYTGSAATTDLLAGRIDMGPMVPSVAKANPSLHALFVIAPERTKLKPDLPSATEVGLNDIKDFGWSAFLTASTTPKEIRDAVESALAKIDKNEAYRKALIDTDTEPLFIPGAEFEKIYQQDYDDMGALLTKLGLR